MGHVDGVGCDQIAALMDTHLDGELSGERSAAFHRHIQDCRACGEAVAQAQRLHRQVLALPMLDCSEATVSAVYRQVGIAPGPVRSRVRPGMPWERFWAWLQGPVIPWALVTVLVAGMGLSTLRERTDPSAGAEIAGVEAEETPRYSAEEIQQAMADLELAMSYLEAVSARTTELVRQQVTQPWAGSPAFPGSRLDTPAPQPAASTRGPF